MTNKFNHLNVPDQWNHYWSRYPQGYTILEALISWVSQVDSMVDNQNKLNDNVEQFRKEIDEFVGRFDERLQTEVTQTLNDWQNSGFLDVVISEALQWQLDNYITTNEQDKLSLTAQLAEIEKKITIRPQDFGAIGDGTSHLLLESFTTLAEAQNVYPFVQTLNKEIDWCAFVAMFRKAKTGNFKVTIPNGQYYIIDPLEVIGTSSVGSTEYGNFTIEGESMQNTVLMFSLTSDSQIGLEFVTQSNGWTLSNFRVKNTGVGSANRLGTGIYLPDTYKSTIKQIQSIFFNIGLKTSAFLTNFTSLSLANNNCGLFWVRGTSTTFTSCYAEYNRKQLNDERNYDYMGVGWYFEDGEYTNLTACASDSNDVAYKIKKTADYKGFTETYLTFDSCGTEGCKSAWVIDSPNSSVTLRHPTVYDVGDGKIAHVENAKEVFIENHTDSTLSKVTLGANVGVGVVKFNHGFNTAGNPSFYPQPTSIDGYGMNDFSYEGINVSGLPLVHGKMLYSGSTLEFELLTVANGRGVSAIIEVVPNLDYSGGTINRGGKIYANKSHGAGRNISTTNAEIITTVENITGGVKVTVDPFNGLSGATSSRAIFIVDVFFSPVGVDGNGKDHNIKKVGAYSGRANCRLKGVDY